MSMGDDKSTMIQSGDPAEHFIHCQTHHSDYAMIPVISGMLAPRRLKTAALCLPQPNSDATDHNRLQPLHRHDLHW
jgi:hypothetical protein